MSLIFEWDPDKERLNLDKHGLSFSDAIPVFDDPLARIFADDRHSVGERRATPREQRDYERNT